MRNLRQFGLGIDEVEIAVNCNRQDERAGAAPQSGSIRRRGANSAASHSGAGNHVHAHDKPPATTGLRGGCPRSARRSFYIINTVPNSKPQGRYHAMRDGPIVDRITLLTQRINAVHERGYGPRPRLIFLLGSLPKSTSKEGALGFIQRD
jgi:hypothetical protein